MADITLDSDTSSESELDLEDMLVESDDFSDDTLQALRGDPHWYTNAPASSSIDAESENVIESETISAFNRVDTYEPRPIDWPRRAREVPRRVLELPDDPETIGELEDALVEARESLEAMSSLRGHTISFMVEIAQLLGARRISIRPIMQIGSHVHRNIELALSGLEFDYTDLGFESPVNTMAHSQLLQLLATPLRILWPQVRRKWRSAIFDAEQHLVDVPVNALAAINEMAETSEINLRVFFAVLIHNYYWKIAKAYCYIFAAVWRESFGAAIGFFERQLA